ncbi:MULTISPECIES: dihydrofolate reductase [Hungatella]|uniref:dihydrofolate reductase n=1 Tax=Hungatella hathewayi TaxID=154046 RepID=A0AAW9WB03_9FIRM|nr:MULTISPECIES: dihydrofolate reductase [Hungatella]MCQ4829835.1 dihydrofolate reductase [Hungatella sp. SL.1.14]MUB62361.1 dihydrofolate reductase [Hungatella hathewayi]CUP18455.1 dihydrofolate reductase subunit [Hungatella hathewayi]
MKTIVAVDRNWGIGRDGGLLTHLPEDMKFFRTTTKNKIVIMGRKTLESFPEGKPLKNRINILLTGNYDYCPEGTVICHSVEEVLEAVRGYDSEDVYIIGGQSVYEQFLPYCDTAYVTYMKAELSPDTYFINLDEREDWEMVQVGEDKVYESLHFEFRTYKKK